MIRASHFRDIGKRYQNIIGTINITSIICLARSARESARQSRIDKKTKLRDNRVFILYTSVARANNNYATESNLQSICGITLKLHRDILIKII